MKQKTVGKSIKKVGSLKKINTINKYLTKLTKNKDRKPKLLISVMKQWI